MKKIAATKDLQDEPPSHAEEVLSNAQVITWSCVLTWEASFITLGNLFTIITFTFIKKLRPKKSLYLVINMAFADLLLGSVCLPISIFTLVTYEQLSQERSPVFLKMIIVVFAQASFISAALISAERFYAIYWPLKHRTLSARAYRLVILTVWLLAILGSISTFFLLKFLSIVDLHFLLCLYGLSIVLTICSLNIGIWRKFRQKTVPHHQNRALQNRRLTKTLLFASLIASGSWIPTIVYNLMVFLGYKITNNIFLVTFLIFFFNSLVNPVLYALRIPDSKHALSLFFFTGRQVIGNKGNIGTDEMAAALTQVTQQKMWTKDHSNLQLTFEQVILEDTKL